MEPTRAEFEPIWLSFVRSALEKLELELMLGCTLCNLVFFSLKKISRHGFNSVLRNSTLVRVRALILPSSRSSQEVFGLSVVLSRIGMQNNINVTISMIQNSMNEQLT